MGENPQAQGGEKRVRSKVRSPRTLPAASLFCLLLTETPARLQTFACQEPPPEHLPNSCVAFMAQLMYSSETSLVLPRLSGLWVPVGKSLGEGEDCIIIAFD